MNKFLLLFVSFSFFTISDLFAQENVNSASPGWKIGGGPVLELNYNVDKSFSSLVFSGLNYGGLIQLVANKSKTRNVFALQFVQGNLKTNSISAGLQQTQYANFDNSFFLKVNPSTDQFIQWGAGSSIHVLYTNRKYDDFINGNKTFEFASSIGASIFFLHEFKGSFDGLSMYDQLDVPLFSYLIQPPFGYANPSNTNNNKSLYSQGITTFASSGQFRNSFIVDKEINDQQLLSLNYTWNYYHFGKSRDVRNAGHSINISYFHTL